MRIRYVVATAGVPLSGPSGASAHVREVTRALAARGHQVDLVGVRSVDRRGQADDPGVPWRVTGSAGWPSWLRRWEWWREIRTARRLARKARGSPPVDLVWERHTLFSDAASRLARPLGVPWVLEVNAPPTRERALFEDPVPSHVGLRWERAVLRDAPSVVAVSGWLVRWLVEEVGCDPARVHRVPNGVRARPGDRERARAGLGVAEDAFLVGFLGSFRPWHGTDLLVPLLERIPEATLLLLGQAPPDLASHPRVLSPGRVPQESVPDLVAAMDVGLAPYPADAPPWFCPLKVLEYRAQGTPVVASDVGECGLLVGDGGTLVPPPGAGPQAPGDLDALARAIRSWRGRRTLPWIRSWETVADEVLATVAPVGSGT